MSYRKKHNFLKNTINLSEYKGMDFSKFSIAELRKMWKDTLTKGMHGICFSIYEDGQEPGDIITEEQVERRIKILKPHTKWIRSFSCIEGNEHIPRIAKKQGLKNMVGAWLSDDLEKNELEIEVDVDERTYYKDKQLQLF